MANHGAILNGTLIDDGGEACACGFQYGTTPAYGLVTPTTSQVTGDTFAQAIAGLTPATTYHYRAFATNSAGTSYGADQVFSTPFELAVVSTLPAAGITDEQAVLNGHVDNDGGAPGQIAFQYGGSASYGMQTPFQTSGFVTGDSFSATITGLSGGQQYHYRAVFQGQNGTIVYGQDITFSTLPAEGGMVLLDEDLQMVLTATEEES